MPMNPMQRKSRNSFLLGMLLMLFIASLIIGFLMFQIVNMKKAEQERKSAVRRVYVLNKDVKSGEVIRPDMIKEEEVSANGVPMNAIGNMNVFQSYSLVEKNTGRRINYDSRDGKLYIILSTIEEGKDGKIYATDDMKNKTDITQKNDKYYRDGEVIQTININDKIYEYELVTQDKNNFYKMVDGEKELIEIDDYLIIAKNDMNANTVLTLSNITKGEKINNDARLQEYNMIVLPMVLEPEEYIDIRLQLPTGQDYIVVSKKRIENVQENTIWINMSEEETLIMSNAMVEAYMVGGARLYATKFLEPGMQEKASYTYIPSAEVLNLIAANPNITNEAMTALSRQYNEKIKEQRNYINDSIQGEEEPLTNVKTKVEEQIKKQNELREKYLQTLGEE